MRCKNCGHPVMVRHEREGLIHETGKYQCRFPKGDLRIKVAE